MSCDSVCVQATVLQGASSNAVLQGASDSTVLQGSRMPATVLQRASWLLQGASCSSYSALRAQKLQNAI